MLYTVVAARKGRDKHDRKVVTNFNDRVEEEEKKNHMNYDNLLI